MDGTGTFSRTSSVWRPAPLKLPGKEVREDQNMIGVIAVLKIKDGTAAEFEAIFSELSEKVRANEAGNKLYQLTKSRTEPNTYKVLELYADAEALATHGQTEYFKDLGRKMGAVMDGRPAVEVLDSVG